MSEGSRPNAPKILVIDDDYELLKLIRLLLGRIGADTITCTDGQSALHELQRVKPDLIILDLMLPDVDGFQLLRIIRAQQTFADVPLLILSARVDPEWIRKGLEGGADGYVTKPYIATNLIERVRLLLRAGRQDVSGADRSSLP